MFPTHPQAIVWTRIEPAYQFNLYEYLSADIHSLQSWIAKEADLSAFRQRLEDWDGLGASAPDPTVVDRAISFLHILRARDRSNPPRRVVLSSDGLIALEWVEGRKFVQAEIGNSNEIEWMIASPGQPTEFRVEFLPMQTDSEQAEGQAWRPPTSIAVDVPAFVSER